VQACEPIADPDEAFHEYGIHLIPAAELEPATAVVAAVAHRQFLDWSPENLSRCLGDNPVLIDVKGIYDHRAMTAAGIRGWRL